MTALALRDDQQYWDEGQLAVLRQVGIGEDVTRPELTAFLHECKRRKLDPFTRQIYLIGRFDRRAGRVVYRSQTSIDGLRLTARRAADRSGIEYSYEDTAWFDSKGERREVWLSDMPPAAAKVVVIRNGCRFDAMARYNAYVDKDGQGNPRGMWRTMPDTMTAKCAEALALRKAFPEDLGDLYTEEEMGQADDRPSAPAAAQVVRPSNGNGHASQPQQPAQPPRQEPTEAQPEAPAGDLDEDAQELANDAHGALTVADLGRIHGQAKDKGKLSALVADPATGVMGKLGNYLNHRKRQVQEADKALTALKNAAEAAGLEFGSPELDEQVKQLTGAGIEDATAQQLREAAQALARAAAV